jgi:hypothetical protein
MKDILAVIKIMIGLWGIISFLILAAIGAFAFLAFSKNEYMLTDDGKETNFYRKAGMIHYRNDSNIFSLVYSPVYGANAKTFKPIDYSFGKDKKYIYYGQHKQPHVDYQTFEILEGYVYQDKNYRYEIDYKLLKPIVERYEQFTAFIEDNGDKIIIRGGVHEDHIKYVEKQIQFKLPNSYKWFEQKYGVMAIAPKSGEPQYIKYVTPPAPRVFPPIPWDNGNDRDILRMYRYNRGNRNFPKNYLSIMEDRDREETYLFLMEPNIEDNEYKVYKMDDRTQAITLFADDFLQFLEIKINDSDGHINWQ